MATTSKQEETSLDLFTGKHFKIFSEIKKGKKAIYVFSIYESVIFITWAFLSILLILLNIFFNTNYGLSSFILMFFEGPIVGYVGYLIGKFTLLDVLYNEYKIEEIEKQYKVEKKIIRDALDKLDISEKDKNRYTETISEYNRVKRLGNEEKEEATNYVFLNANIWSIFFIAWLGFTVFEIIYFIFTTAYVSLIEMILLILLGPVLSFIGLRRNLLKLYYILYELS